MKQLSPELYTKYLLGVAGLGDLLYGVDIGEMSFSQQGKRAVNV